MPSSVPSDPYSVLGVPREASQTEVSSAFRALVRRYHPDMRGPAHESASELWTDAELRAVLAAYRILRDPTSRTAYDRDHPPLTSRQTAPNAADQEERRRPTRMPRRAAPRASDLFLADPFYASSFFGDPHNGDPYFVYIIR